MKDSQCALLFTGRSATTLTTPLELLPICGKSLLHRAMDALALAGIESVKVMLTDYPADVRAFIGDGARWGCEVTYHLLRDSDPLSDLAKRLSLEPEMRYVVANSSRLPVNFNHIDSRNQDAPTGRVWVTGDKGKIEWSGWARVAGQELLNCVHSYWSAAALVAFKKNFFASFSPALMLKAETAADIPQACRAVSVLEEYHIELGKNAVIHPTAVVLAPSRIGDHVRVGAGCVIGPNAFIEDGALLGENVVVKDAVVMPATYVGDQVHLNGAIADGSALAHLGLNTVLTVRDRHLLSALPKQIRASRPPLRERFFALFLLALLWPIRSLLGRSRSPVMTRTAVHWNETGPPETAHLKMRAPGKSGAQLDSVQGLNYFRDYFYPGLFDIVRGSVRLSGPTLRSSEAIRSLPIEWRQAYVDGRVGLLNESTLMSEPCSPDQAMTSDLFAAVTQNNAAATRKLVLRYFLYLWFQMCGNLTLNSRH